MPTRWVGGGRGREGWAACSGVPDSRAKWIVLERGKLVPLLTNAAGPPWRPSHAGTGSHTAPPDTRRDASRLPEVGEVGQEGAGGKSYPKPCSDLVD